MGGLAFGFSKSVNQNLQAPLTGPMSGPYIFESCIAESNTNSSGTGSGFDIFNLVDSQIITTALLIAITLASTSQISH